MINSGSIFVFGNESYESTVKGFEQVTSFEEMLSSFGKSNLGGFPEVFEEEGRQTIRSRAFV